MRQESQPAESLHDDRNGAGASQFPPGQAGGADPRLIRGSFCLCARPDLLLRSEQKHGVDREEAQDRHA